MIACATIGLCFLTKTVAGWLGIDLPDQQNVEVVKRCLESAFVSSRHFGVAAFLVAQVVVLLPIIEEFVFRWLLFRLPTRLMARWSRTRDARRETGDGRGRRDWSDSYSIIRLFDYSTEAIAKPGRDGVPPPSAAGDGTPALPGSRGFAITSTIFLSSFLFSAAHYLAQPWPDAAFLALFFFGEAQCWLYQKTERLCCAMLNHALFNLTNLVLLFVLPEA